MDANKRIVVNTGILYFKLIFTIIVNLYATRLILNAMGVENFGIVNLISGIVALLSFFQNSLTISTQRFLSVNKGKNDIKKQLRIFNTSILIHFFLGLCVVAILESLTTMIFNSAIQIPVDRISSSQILYQLTILATFFVIITVPYDATLNAHENMLWFSFATIIESIIRLVGAFLMTGYPYDKLVFYGLLIISIRSISMIIKVVYCTRHYNDSKINILLFDKKLLKNMLSFAGWNVIGGFSVSIRSHGMALIFNLFHGVVSNAAYGIANQVFGQLSNFASTISKAMAPQIMQNKGSGNENHMILLSLRQCKYSFILLLFFAVPLFIEMPLILKLWLKQVPENASLFCRLILIVAMIQQVTIGIQTLIQANGKIALYQTIMSVVIFFNVPLAYFSLKIGMPAYSVIVTMIAIELVCMITRLTLANKLVCVSLSLLRRELLSPIFKMFIASSSFVTLLLCAKSNLNSLLDLFVYFFISFIWIIFVAVITLSNEERSSINLFLKKTYRKIIKKGNNV